MTSVAAVPHESSGRDGSRQGLRLSPSIPFGTFPLCNEHTKMFLHDGERCYEICIPLLPMVDDEPEGFVVLAGGEN